MASYTIFESLCRNTVVLFWPILSCLWSNKFLTKFYLSRHALKNIINAKGTACFIVFFIYYCLNQAPGKYQRNIIFRSFRLVHNSQQSLKIWTSLIIFPMVQTEILTTLRFKSFWEVNPCLYKQKLIVDAQTRGLPVYVCLSMWKCAYNVKRSVILRQSRNHFQCQMSPHCCPPGRRSGRTTPFLCPV